MLLRLTDVPGDEEDSRPPSYIGDRCEFEIWSRTRLFLRVAAPWHWPVHDLDQARFTAKHLVVHGVRTDDPRPAAGLGWPQAQQPDEVGRVAMKVLAQVGLVSASGNGWGSFIADMGDDILVAVLSDRLA